MFPIVLTFNGWINRKRITNKAILRASTVVSERIGKDGTNIKILKFQDSLEILMIGFGIIILCGSVFLKECSRPIKSKRDFLKCSLSLINIVRGVSGGRQQILGSISPSRVKDILFLTYFDNLSSDQKCANQWFIQYSML